MQSPVDYAETMKPIVFFDGSCPLCSREIEHYRRLDGSDNLLWVDVSKENDLIESYDLDKETAMARFHVMDADGNWQTGAYAFAELWSHLPRYRWLSYLIRKIRLLTILDRVYSRFALWRLRKNCRNDYCHTNAPD